MKYNCETCHDSGSKNQTGDYLDCPACDMPHIRKALNDFVKSLGPTHPEDVALAIHQRALSMAPKQEAPGKYLDNEEVKQLVAALAMGADNTEALRSEAPRRLVAPLWAQSDCIAAALRIFQDVPAAPAVANGALTDEAIYDISASCEIGIEHDDDETKKRIDFARAILAAAGPDSALVKDAARYRWLRDCDWFSSELCVLRSPKQVLTKTGLTLGADCPSRNRLDEAIDAALSGAKGN